MQTEIDLIGCLDFIDPAELTYDEWTQVGMALKDAGQTCSVWDEWSRRDGARYHSGECWRKWDSFGGSASPVTAGTIVKMAKDRGLGRPDREIGWGDAIEYDGCGADAGWAEEEIIREPDDWKPAEEIVRYLNALYDADDCVAYCTEAYTRDDGGFSPSRGSCSRTAGELIQELGRYKGDVGAVFGDANPDAGAWIKFNPVDGKGTKNENVTDWRFALVECDGVEKGLQLGLYKQQNLPIAIVVDSGNKSVHAIVRIDAESPAEYRKRVDFLYATLKKAGIEIDTQNKNPSRWSRMPGFMRKGKKQFIVEGASGPDSWDSWTEWLAARDDDLPEFDDLATAEVPELAEPVIEGILRRGHKMMLSGPSKAGKSFALIALSICIATGGEWMKWRCRKGKVLYVNFELSRESCLNRFKAMFEQYGLKMGGVDVWNLRGKVVTMKDLLPKLLHRVSGRGYDVIIFDPIYKLLGGDENNAEQVGRFCAQLDRVCAETGCAVVYCHHHSKGAQGGKSAQDRASGSGVFARDADALLDMIQLKAATGAADYDGRSASATAWRMEAVLREFPEPDPVNMWFDYPLHIVDRTGTMDSWKPDMGQASVDDMNRSREEKRNNKVMSAIAAFENLEKQSKTGLVELQAIINTVGGTPETVAKYFPEEEFTFEGDTKNRYSKNGELQPTKAKVIRNKVE